MLVIFCQHLECFAVFYFCLHGSQWDVCHVHILVPYIGKVVFFHWFLSAFPLVFGFSTGKHINKSRCGCFWYLSCLVFQTSAICGLVAGNNFGSISALITSNISFAPFFLVLQLFLHTHTHTHTHTHAYTEFSGFCSFFSACVLILSLLIYLQVY